MKKLLASTLLFFIIIPQAFALSSLLKYGIIASSGGADGTLFEDDFNRGNSASVGGGWTEHPIYDQGKIESNNVEVNSNSWFWQTLINVNAFELTFKTTGTGGSLPEGLQILFGANDSTAVSFATLRAGSNGIQLRSDLDMIAEIDSGSVATSGFFRTLKNVQYTVELRVDSDNDWEMRTWSTGTGSRPGTPTLSGAFAQDATAGTNIKIDAGGGVNAWWVQDLLVTSFTGDL